MSYPLNWYTFSPIWVKLTSTVSRAESVCGEMPRRSALVKVSKVRNRSRSLGECDNITMALGLSLQPNRM